MKYTLSILALIVATGCGTQVKQVVLTDDQGGVYPYSVRITNTSIFDSVAIVVGFTTQAKAEAYAAEAAKNPKLTVRLIEGK